MDARRAHFFAAVFFSSSKACRARLRMVRTSEDLQKADKESLDRSALEAPAKVHRSKKKCAVTFSQ